MGNVIFQRCHYTSEDRSKKRKRSAAESRLVLQTGCPVGFLHVLINESQGATIRSASSVQMRLPFRISGIRLELDHKLPKSKGGNDDLDNLQTLCFECNRGKKDTTEE
jgi:5-methylcytosine-specific restriction endonuclease McrA